MNGKDRICFRLEATALNRQIRRSWRRLLNKYASRIKTEADAIEVSIAKWNLVTSLGGTDCGYCVLYECAECPVSEECHKVLAMAPRDVVQKLKEIREKRW